MTPIKEKKVRQRKEKLSLLPLLFSSKTWTYPVPPDPFLISRYTAGLRIFVDKIPWRMERAAPGTLRIKGSEWLQGWLSVTRPVRFHFESGREPFFYW
jgi:hypothetical protein